MIQQYFRGEERGRAFGYFGATVGIAVAIGPVLGGFLIKIGGPDHGWRLTMLVNAPIGLLAIILVFMWFPRPLFSRVRDAAGNKLGIFKALATLDPIGALILGAAVWCILFPFMDSTGHPPMVDLNIFATSSFRNGTIIATLWFMGITSIWVLVALYFQNGLGYSALAAGSVGIPSALLNSITATIAGRKISRYGRIVVTIGMLTTIFGLFTTVVFIWGTTHWGMSEWWLILSLAFIGLGQGAVVSPNQTLTLAQVPDNYAGSSGAVLQTGQRIGTAIGLAVITAIVFAMLQSTSGDWPVSIMIGFRVIIAVCLVSLSFGFADQRTSRS